jgi:glutathione transport system permease protein
VLDYLLRRLALTVPVLLAVTVFVFFFVHLLPGDPARLVAGPDATLQDIEAVRQDLGLDRPLWWQYGHYLAQLVQLQLGRSIKTHQPVSELIGERFMPTLWLTLAAMAWATLTGVALGVLSGLLLIDIFSVRLHLLPTGGYGTWQHLVLPSFTLGVAVAAVMARFTRSAFIEVAGEDYVRTARSKGVAERGVIWAHTLPNALIPVITLVGLEFGFLLGGAIVVETVFAYPGLGRLLVDSVNYRDYPVIQTVILLFAAEFVLINLIVDVLYGVVNPEIRLR